MVLHAPFVRLFRSGSHASDDTISNGMSSSGGARRRESVGSELHVEGDGQAGIWRSEAADAEATLVEAFAEAREVRDLEDAIDLAEAEEVDVVRAFQAGQAAQVRERERERMANKLNRS